MITKVMIISERVSGVSRTHSATDTGKRIGTKADVHTDEPNHADDGFLPSFV